MVNATSTQLQELYVAYFGRPADPTGLDYWLSNGVSQSYFASIMHAQPEFKDAYGSSSTETQVNQIYRHLFNRDADAEGLTYWSNQINNDSLQLAEIATHLIWAAKNNTGSADDLTALNNRRDAAVGFTSEVRTSVECLMAYESDAGLVIGKDFLLGIDKDTPHTQFDIDSICTDLIDPCLFCVPDPIL